MKNRIKCQKNVHAEFKNDRFDRKKKLKEDVIANYHMLDEKTVDKIDKMCINNVQMKFFSVKSEDD
jgi:hypothetical protein